MQAIMVPNGGGDIGDEIGVADFMSVLDTLHGELVQFLINRHGAAQLPPPGAVRGLAVAQIGNGVFRRGALTDKVQPHRRFEMIPRVNNAVFEPRDGAVRVLQGENNIARAIKCAVGQNAHAAGFSKYRTTLLPISGSASAESARRGSGFLRISTSSNFL